MILSLEGANVGADVPRQLKKLLPGGQWVPVRVGELTVVRCRCLGVLLGTAGALVILVARDDIDGALLLPEVACGVERRYLVAVLVRDVGALAPAALALAPAAVPP